MSDNKQATKMEYVRVGKSGLKVSKIIMGCMQYGSQQSWMIADHDEGIKQLKYAYDQGINTFDTANVYSAGESEIILGKFLKQENIPRESVVILTKTYGADSEPKEKGPGGNVNYEGLSRKRIFASVQNSLKRLQLDYIDLLQCHRFDYNTPIEETMQALHDVVQAGWVRYVGMSSCWAWQFQLMQQYAIHNRLTPFISMQNQHSATMREEEREMMPMLRHFGVGVIPWSPLAGGLLTRPLEEYEGTARGKSRVQEQSLGQLPGDKAINKRVYEIAQKRSIPMAQVALAWSFQSPWVDAPIIGSRSNERLQELIDALQVKLDEEEIKSINDLYQTIPPRSFT